MSAAVNERGLPLRVEGGGSLLSLACEPEVSRPDVVMTGLALAFGNRGVFGFPYLSTSSVMAERHIKSVLNTGDDVLTDIASAL